MAPYSAEAVICDKGRVLPLHTRDTRTRPPLSFVVVLLVVLVVDIVHGLVAIVQVVAAGRDVETSRGGETAAKRG